MQDFWIFANLIRNFVECVLYAPPPPSARFPPRPYPIPLDSHKVNWAIIWYKLWKNMDTLHDDLMENGDWKKNVVVEF